MTKHNKTKHLSTRVKPEVHAAFIRTAEKIARPSDVLRSLVESFLKAQPKPEGTENVS